MILIPNPIKIIMYGKSYKINLSELCMRVFITLQFVVYSILWWWVSRTNEFSCLPKVLVENFSSTCARASMPILTANSGSVISWDIGFEKSSGVGSQRKPVTLSFTVSTGPPLLHAITGFWAAMASKGTMPKCSSCIHRIGQSGQHQGMMFNEGIILCPTWFNSMMAWNKINP